mmetsp:Transcript_7969/g.15482  ORF Transcript_7969/g.15482 Transcript_7969/m.15482 type:complete len:224 (-) Transcript_7969:66-737(-)
MLGSSWAFSLKPASPTVPLRSMPSRKPMFRLFLLDRVSTSSSLSFSEETASIATPLFSLCSFASVASGESGRKRAIKDPTPKATPLSRSLAVNADRNAKYAPAPSTRNTAASCHNGAFSISGRPESTEPAYRRGVSRCPGSGGAALEGSCTASAWSLEAGAAQTATCATERCVAAAVEKSWRRACGRGAPCSSATRRSATAAAHTADAARGWAVGGARGSAAP